MNFYIALDSDHPTTCIKRFKIDLTRISNTNKDRLSKQFTKMENLLNDSNPLDKVILKDESANIRIKIPFTQSRDQNKAGLGGREETRRHKRKVKYENQLQKEEEEKFYSQLYATFKEMERKYKKSCLEISEAFMKVSGDIKSLRDYLDGKIVTEWNHLEDLALTKPEDSREYQHLLESKGKEEVAKRKRFLQEKDIFEEEELLC